ncbi:MAG: hypothetical protein V1743_01970 [Nanoarchaeota archaeon]
MQKHTKMSSSFEELKATLRFPDVLQTFEYDPAVHFYYKYYKREQRFLFVSVKYLNGEGFIITAFYTDRIK